MGRVGKVAALGTVLRVLRQSGKPGSPGLGERARAVPRLAVATLTGRYPGLGRGRLALFALALVYVVSPIDVLPEAALWFLGVVDDIGVAAWLAGALLVETDQFLAWERERTRVIPGEVVDRAR